MEPSKRKRTYIKRNKRKKSTPPRIKLTVAMKQHVLEALRSAAAHHKVTLSTYLQWLLERSVRDEIQYYGWPDLKAKPISKPNPRIEAKDMQKLYRLANRRRKKVANVPTQGE